MTVSLRTLHGGPAILQPGELERLRARVHELLAPASPGYDEARSIWNAMVDRRPGLIARCEKSEQVAHAVRFARDHQLLVAVHGGGHNIAGNAVCEGGLMIDLSLMKAVEVDSARRTARVGPGCTLAEVDRETQAHGLAVPVGINSTTGIAGLTLGGGFGWSSRRHGMTVDNLLSVEIVTGDGQRVRASEAENPELFWGIRGGGGNFGVVTSFQFQLHPFGPEVLSGLIVHPFEDAAAVLGFYREFAATLPDATAYPHREAEFIMNVHARWADAAGDHACIGWARDLLGATAPFATGGVYVNFMPDDETDRIRGAYGANLDRLVALKDRYDPINLFRMNQPIRPSDTGRSGPALAAAPLPA